MMKRFAIFALFTSVLLASAPVASSETLNLSVDTSRATGNIRAAVFASRDAFEQGVVLTDRSQPAQAGTTELQITNLESGTYAIAVFQDLDGNETLDRNLPGAPSEPFGFSNNPIIKCSAPQFEEISFKLGTAPLTLRITLNGE